MKRIFNILFEAFSISLFLVSVVACGKIKGGGPYDINGNGGKITVGSRYGLDINFGKETIRNAQVIEFSSGKEWSIAVLNMDGSGYEIQGRGTYEIKNKIIRFTVTWEKHQGPKDDVPPPFDFEIINSNELRGHRGEIWHKL